MEDELNPFAQMIDEAGNKDTDTPVERKAAPVKPDAPKKEPGKRGRPSQGILEEKTKSFLLRTDEETFNVLQMFAKVKKESVNNIVELAVKEFMTRKDNKADYDSAVNMANLLK